MSPLKMEFGDILFSTQVVHSSNPCVDLILWDDTKSPTTTPFVRWIRWNPKGDRRPDGVTQPTSDVPTFEPRTQELRMEPLF